MVIATERVRKAQELNVALAKRGYALRGGDPLTWRSSFNLPLASSSRGWEARIGPLEGTTRRGLDLMQIEAEDYAALLRTVDDDMAWAQYQYQRIDIKRAQNAHQNADYDVRRKLRQWQECEANLVSAEVAGAESALDSLLEQARGARDAYKAALIKSGVALERVREAIAAQPANPHDAAVYLASLPTLEG